MRPDLCIFPIPVPTLEVRGKQRTLDLEAYYWMLPAARILIVQNLSATHVIIISACLMDIVALLSGQ